MAAYGVFRVAAFHPVFRPKYRGWLEQTPWTSRKPLPLGPIHLVWQDVLVLGIVVLALHGTPLGRVWASWAFLLAYLGTLGVSFWLTGPWWMGYLVLFGLGLAVRLVVEPLVALAALVPIYAIAMLGRNMALARFPWHESKIVEAMRRQFRPNSATRRKSTLGWPNHHSWLHGRIARSVAATESWAAAGGLVGVRVGANVSETDGPSRLFPSCCSSTLPLSHSSFGC